MRRTFGPSRGNRKPPQTTTSAPQKGGGVVHAPPEITTVHSNGTVTTSGYPTEKAARHAKKAAQTSRRRVQRIVRETTPKPQKRSERPVSYTPPKQPKPASFTPKKFQGAPTAGSPTLGELRIANQEGTLKANKRGYLTTPKVRKASKNLKAAKRVAQKSSGPLPGLGPEETRIARKVLKVGARMGATRKEKLAAIETGLQETGFKNLKPYENSFNENTAGWREELAPYYTGRLNVKKSAREFFKETKTDPTVPGGGGETPGELAQTVQGSAYGGEETYGTHAAQAHKILHAFNHGANPKAAKRLQKAEAQAESVGLNVKGHPSPKVVKAFKKALKTMSAIDSKHFEYVWGGGHGTFTGPYDCSGAVSAMIHSVAPGAIPAPLTSGSMGSALKPGPGAITVFYNGEHTFAYIPSLHKYWGTSESNPGGGAGFFPKSVGDSEVASGNSAGSYQVGHVPGLGKKVALQMGGALTFPGMTVSPSGTTATINPGSGAVVQSPGFSTRPIKLTPAQKAKRTLHKLDTLGVGVSPGKQPSSQGPDSKTLKALEAKYGVR